MAVSLSPVLLKNGGDGTNRCKCTADLLELHHKAWPAYLPLGRKGEARPRPLPTPLHDLSHACENEALPFIAFFFQFQNSFRRMMPRCPDAAKLGLGSRATVTHWGFMSSVVSLLVYPLSRSAANVFVEGIAPSIPSHENLVRVDRQYVRPLRVRCGESPLSASYLPIFSTQRPQLFPSQCTRLAQFCPQMDGPPLPIFSSIGENNAESILQRRSFPQTVTDGCNNSVLRRSSANSKTLACRPKKLLTMSKFATPTIFHQEASG